MPSLKHVLIFLLMVITGKALSQGFAKGDALVAIEIGATHLFKENVNRTTKSESFKTSFNGTINVSPIRGTNPIAIRYEYALSKNFGLGFSVCWWKIAFHVEDRFTVGSGNNASQKTDVYDYNLSSISFGVRPNYHFPLKSKKIDLYAGGSFGLTKNKLVLNVPSAFAYYEGSGPLALYLAPIMGCRYFLTDNFGLNFEAGYEKGALFLAGLALRFRPTKYVMQK